MLNEFKRPMWNDGPAKQPWLNYFNEYERTHCCFGDDDNPDESENGVERGELGDFNVDPGYNPDTSMNQVDGGFVSDAGTSFTTDPTTGELNVDASGRVGPDGTVGIEGELGYNDLVDMGYFDALDKSIQAQDLKQADELNKEFAAKDLDAQVTVDKQGNYSYTGPDMFSALGGEIGKAATELSPTIQLSKAIAEQGGLSGFFSKAKDDFSPSAKQTFGTVKDSGPTLGVGEYNRPTSLQASLARDPNKVTITNLPEPDYIKDDKLNNLVATLMEMQESGYRDRSKAEISPDALSTDRELSYVEGVGWIDRNAVDDMLKNRSRGGMVYRNEGGGVEEKTKSAMELYLEKLGQPSKYTVPMVPMNTPSMAPAPDTSDPFALAEYRKNLARETMGSYLPYDPAGASSAINTFNENYYGGASNVNPYNVAQLASLYGLPRDAATYEGIIGMLGGVRSEAPPPPPPVVPDPEPEPVIVEEEEDDDNWSMYDDEEIDNMGYLKGGGGIRDVLYRQTGGAANPQVGVAMPGGVFNQLPPNATSIMPDYLERRMMPPQPFFPGPGHPDYPGTMPPEPPKPEPPKPEPPPPPPEPKIIYDPVREEAARKRARELQALKIGELDTAPQTTAERLALEKSGGFYRDDAGNVRDASGAFQEDFAYDYTAPPPIDSGLSGDDFNFTGDPDPVPEPPPPTDPIPLPGVDPIPLPDDPIRPGPVYPLPYPFPDKPITYPDRPGVVYPYDPSQPFQPSGPDGGPMMGQQLQPTGLQGLQQGMQTPNVYPRPSMQSQNMQGLGQNLQGFGMQSPRPFGTQQPFSSGFGGFGQQPNYNSPYTR